MPKKARKPGRPLKPANSRRSRLIQINLTPSEDDEIREGAAEAGLTLRDYLVGCARRIALDPRAPTPLQPDR
jgi:hypothetical protein